MWTGGGNRTDCGWSPSGRGINIIFGNIDWEEATVLITGGTGSFGKKFTEIMLREYQPKKLIIFSRDELKQHEMRMSGFGHPSVYYFIANM